MQVVQTLIRSTDGLSDALKDLSAIQPQLVLAFGPAHWLKALEAHRLPFAKAHWLGCTTAGEISSQGVSDDSCSVTAIRFDQAKVHAASTRLAGMEDSFAAGQRLAHALPQADLRCVMVLGQGVNINGSALIAGLTQGLAPGALVTGGLAGDDANFKQTSVLHDGGVDAEHVACVGLYGAQLQVTHGSFGGWLPFGPARKVTRCVSNVLFELDGEPALDVYKRYLGDHAKDLPASGLLFPFLMLGRDHSELGIIRTILAVDAEQGSLTLAGDIESEGYLRLMHAGTDALVEGAEVAATAANEVLADSSQSLALLVSCVGRKLVMGGRVEEEVEAVADVLGKAAVLTGFYSYGEISPLSGEVACKLHNQTMTITRVSEASHTAAI
ncbi:MAG: FIST C-terminal domain-containing protein [Rhodoferax sp.]|nr:FIST C-terminal domain-containing protein [Rhodoferax sp.]